MSLQAKSGAQRTDRLWIQIDLPISSRCSIIRSSDYREKSAETLVGQFKVWLGTMCQETHFCSVTTLKTSFTTLGHLIVGVKSQDTKSPQEGTKMTRMTRSARSYSEMIHIGIQKLQLSQGKMKCPLTPSLHSWGTHHLMRRLRELTWLKMTTQKILWFQLKRFKSLGDKRESRFKWAWTPLRSSCTTKIPRPRQPCRSWPIPGRRPHKTK
jgi:hypothetical protein